MGFDFNQRILLVVFSKDGFEFGDFESHVRELLIIQKFLKVSGEESRVIHQVLFLSIVMLSFWRVFLLTLSWGVRLRVLSCPSLEISQN